MLSHPLNRSVTLGLTVLVTGLVKGIIQGFHVYDLVASLLCSACVLGPWCRYSRL